MIKRLFHARAHPFAEEVLPQDQGQLAWPGSARHFCRDRAAISLRRLAGIKKCNRFKIMDETQNSPFFFLKNGQFLDIFFSFLFFIGKAGLNLTHEAHLLAITPPNQFLHGTKS